MFYQVTDSFGSFFQVLTFKQALAKLPLCSSTAKVHKLNIFTGRWVLVAERKQGLQANNVFRVASSTELVKKTEAFKQSRKFFRSNPEQALMVSAGKALEKLLRAIPVQGPTCKQVCLYISQSGCSKGLLPVKGSACSKV